MTATITAPRKSRTTTKSKETIGEGAKKLQRAAIKRQNTTYTGAPIQATKVFKNDISDKFRAKQHWKRGVRVEVINWMILNEVKGTACYANTYHGKLKSSYDEADYTFPLTLPTTKRAVAKKVELFEEVEATDWPEWICHQKRRASK